MPRVARVVVPGVPHHVVQRGNNRQDVFFVDEDREAYLGFLGAQCERFGVSIFSYCLMSNHVHLVAVPRAEESLAQAVGRTHWLYSQYVNRVHRRSGHLWQNRFYSCPLEEVHLWRACVFVERNPVRARRVRLAWRYEWSSAGAHVGEAEAAGCLDVDEWRAWGAPRGWRRELQRPEDEDEGERLMVATLRGRPLGSDSFVSKLERRLGRRLRARPVGRPRVEKKKRGKKGRGRKNG